MAKARLDREEVRALFRPREQDKKAKREEQGDGLGPLTGCRVLVVSGGAISVKRAELLANIAGKNGATSSAVTSSHSLAGACAHGQQLTVVAAHNLGHEELCNRLPGLADLQADERATVVADSWLTKCAEEKRCCPAQEHLHLARGGGKDESVAGRALGQCDAVNATSVLRESVLPPGLPPQKVLVGGLAVDAIGFGSMSLGVTYPDVSNRPSREDAIAMIHSALDLGCEFFDTADAYCTDGNDMGYVEEILREALASFSLHKETTAIVATKGCAFL